MSKEFDDILAALKRTAKSLKNDIENLDVDKEATHLMNETEKVLDDLGDSISRKRKEIEEKGVEEIIKKDVHELEKGVKKMVEDIEKMVK